MLRASLFLTLLFCFAFQQTLPAQVPGDFAEIVDISHACPMGTGSVEFEIVGNPDNYIWYWTHGPTDLYLDGLQPGIYTLIVEDLLGCKQEYEIEILEIFECTGTGTVLATEKPCFALIVIEITTGMGTIPIQEEALDIVWADGANEGLQRIVPVPENQSVVYCVDVSITDGNGTCCITSVCVTVNGNPECEKIIEAEVIVNEFNRSESGDRQFVELLVLGNGKCEETFDLRGYILDDNNGQLIQPNQFVNQYNANQIGVDPGYLAFSYNDNWDSIPNGSLIVIYDEIGDKHPAIPLDDPTDADNDGVYVLASNASNYLYAKTGFWDDFEDQVQYQGTLQDPAWDLIKLTPNADGLQVRYPDGEYCHGISTGQSPFAAPNDFHLYLNESSVIDQNCRLIGSNYMDKTEFECLPDSMDFQTPGNPNSQTNALMIFDMLECNTSSAGENPEYRQDVETNGHKTESQLLRAFPNPGTGSVYLDYISVLEGPAKLQLYNPSGRLIWTSEQVSQQGPGQWHVDFEDQTASGMYLLEVLFPNGDRKTIRLVIMK